MRAKSRVYKQISKCDISSVITPNQVFQDPKFIRKTRSTIPFKHNFQFGFQSVQKLQNSPDKHKITDFRKLQTRIILSSYVRIPIFKSPFWVKFNKLQTCSNRFFRHDPGSYSFDKNSPGIYFPDFPGKPGNLQTR